MKCPNCKGMGKLNGPAYAPPISRSSKACPTCKGTGHADERFRNMVICPVCKGWGVEPPLNKNNTCQRCIGVGMTARK